MFSGDIVGYDPGGDGNHGLAILRVVDGRPVSHTAATCVSLQDVLARIGQLSTVLGFGIDTLTCWSTGRCGWRPADRWLRSRYPVALKSVVSPNALYGSMGLNGMAAALATRTLFPRSRVIETHPKVLYCHLSGTKYNWLASRSAMCSQLGVWLQQDIAPSTDHEWDALISAFAALKGLRGDWAFDLHELPVEAGEALITPVGQTHYYWPS